VPGVVIEIELWLFISLGFILEIRGYEHNRTVWDQQTDILSYLNDTKWLPHSSL